MNRDHVFSIQSPQGMFECALLAEAEIEQEDGAVKATLGWAGVSASGPTEPDALQALVGEIAQKIGDFTGPFAETLLGYLDAKGRQLSQQEVDDKQFTAHTGRELRTDLTPDEQYQIVLFKDAEMRREGDTVTVRLPWLEVEGGGATVQEAFGKLLNAVNEVGGTEASPGPSYDAYAAYTREHGRRIPAEQLERERAEKQAYDQTKESIPGISPDDIDGLSRQGIPLLVDFWAEWCAPCRAITPVLAELQTAWDGKMLFRKVNIDDHKESGDRYKFRGIPCLIVFRDGDEIHRVMGFGGREALVKSLEPLIA